MRPLPLPDWDKSLQRVLDDMDGQPLNVHGLMANHPTLLNAWWDLRMHSVNGGELDQRDCELVILRVAVHMRCWYEWASHVDRGLAAGLTEDEIERVAHGPSATEWNERDAILLETIDELFHEHAISESTREILSEYLDANQVMDVIAIHGVYVTLGCMVNTWGLELDERVRARLPDDVTEEAFVAESGS